MKDNIEEIINSLLENEINDSKSKILNEIKEYITNDENFQKDDRDIILNKDIVKKFNEIYLTQNNTAKVLF